MVRPHLVDEAPVTRNICEQPPARTAGQTIRNADKLRTPAIDGAEGLRDSARNCVRQNAPIAAQACKIQFMQNGSIGRRNLVAFQSGQPWVGSLAELKPLNFVGDRLTARYG